MGVTKFHSIFGCLHFGVAEAHTPIQHSIKRTYTHGRPGINRDAQFIRRNQSFRRIRSVMKKSGESVLVSRRLSTAFLPSSSSSLSQTLWAPKCRARLLASTSAVRHTSIARMHYHHDIFHKTDVLSLQRNPYLTIFDIAAPNTHFSQTKTYFNTILRASASEDNATARSIIDMETLSDMDIVLFSQKKPDNDNAQSNSTNSFLQLGAIQEDGTLAPLSAWTNEPAFTNPDGQESMEFVVDEEDRWLERLKPENVVVHSVLDADVIGYGSRQVGGGKGLGNPHGEESELLYYVEKHVLDEIGVDVVVKPDLEILY